MNSQYKVFRNTRKLRLTLTLVVFELLMSFWLTEWGKSLTLTLVVFESNPSTCPKCLCTMFNLNIGCIWMISGDEPAGTQNTFNLNIGCIWIVGYWYDPKLVTFCLTLTLVVFESRCRYIAEEHRKMFNLNIGCIWIQANCSGTNLKRGLTLTLVVFECFYEIKNRKIIFRLTLTLVVFEYLVTLIPQTSILSLTLTLVVFEFPYFKYTRFG